MIKEENLEMPEGMSFLKKWRASGALLKRFCEAIDEDNRI